MWVQASSNAYRCSPALATVTVVPATSNARISPALTSLELPTRTGTCHLDAQFDDTIARSRTIARGRSKELDQPSRIVR